MLTIKVWADIIIKTGLKDMTPKEIVLAVEQKLNEKQTITINGHGQSKPYVGLRVHVNDFIVEGEPIEENES